MYFEINFYIKIPYIYACVCVYVYADIYAYIYVYVCMYMHIYMYVLIYMCIYMYVCLYMCIYMCIYMCKYMYIYANINVYESLHINTSILPLPRPLKAIVDVWRRSEHKPSLLACHKFSIQLSIAHSLQLLVKFTVLLQHYSRINKPNDDVLCA